ncbi:MAG: hypothetical protein IH582_02500 [Afipia sp.]|nr:hypothetical protein [Afipia sp.]
MTTIGAYSTSLLNSASQGYATTTAQPSLAQVLDEQNSDSSSSSSTNVTLSDAAKSYLASMQDAAATGDSADVSFDTLAANAREWFDTQYDSLGISSAMLDGKVAVDFSSQSRATLSAVASNTDGFFTSDESAAATSELQARFNNAMASHVVIARHTGDYASLYQAASDYLDQASDGEKATAAWKAQKLAVTAGLSAAKSNFGKAPDTGDANDPVAALLDAPDSGITTLGSDATTSQVAANARAMLDDQENKAKDNGTTLSFYSSQTSGQKVDFTNFDNRTLATIVLNPDSSFSSDEIYAAKQELNQRTRAAMYNTLFPSSNGSPDSSSTGALGLMQTYNNMSAEEKTVLGVTDTTTSRVLASYKTQQSVQNTLASYL